MMAMVAVIGWDDCTMQYGSEQSLSQESAKPSVDGACPLEIRQAQLFLKPEKESPVVGALLSCLPAFFPIILSFEAFTLLYVL
jgi:hypothetical protein